MGVFRVCHWFTHMELQIVGWLSSLGSCCEQMWFRRHPMERHLVRISFTDSSCTSNPIISSGGAICECNRRFGVIAKNYSGAIGCLLLSALSDWELMSLIRIL